MKRKTADALPLAAKALLRLFLGREDYFQAAGDFEESYRNRRKTTGAFRAAFWLWFMILKSLPGFATDFIQGSAAMLLNYVKIAWRVLFRQKLFSLLNIVGLAVSLTCVLILFLHIRYELSYESGFPKADRIYRVQVNSKYGSNLRNWAASAPALGPLLERSFPEIELTARISPLGTQIMSLPSDRGTSKRIEEYRGFYADPSALTIFDLEFVSGDPSTALREPHSLVLTASMAARYFGESDPLNQTLVMDGRDQPLLVTGIFQDLPANTHLKINYLVSMSNFGIDMGNQDLLHHRTWKSMYTYVLLRSPADAPRFAEKSPPFMRDYHADRPNRVENLVLQPIGRIHLHSRLEGEMRPNGDIAYVYIFSAAGLLILLIAGVNFVNLSTALSFKRAREIGVRKVIGARKGQIIHQYLGESLLITLAAGAVGICFSAAAIPLYNRLAGRSLAVRSILTPENLLLYLFLIGLLGILAGLYPAFFISAFQPVSTLTSGKNPRSFAARLRRGLVMVQFVISIFMIFGTITIHRQLAFFQNRDLGFDKDQLVAVRLYPDQRRAVHRNARALKAELRGLSAVSHVALISHLPGGSFSNERLTPVGTADKTTLPMLRFVRVDEDFIETAGLDLLEGRNFDPASDQPSAYIISESVASVMGLERPLGLACESDVHGETASVVGVIKNFHFASLHAPIQPLVLEYRPEWTGWLLVKVQSRRFPEVLAFLESKFAEIAPGQLFRYLFVDEYFDRNYAQERSSGRLFRVFTVLAILVAGLGLFGLTVYAAQVRVKEIGIRKVLGASLSGLALLMSREFLIWVMLANVAAWPLAYWAMDRWLAEFAYRVQINLETFILAGGLSMLLAGLTVSFQAIKTAAADPVQSLRYE